MNLIHCRIGQASEPTSPSRPHPRRIREPGGSRPSPPRPADHDRPSRFLGGVSPRHHRHPIPEESANPAAAAPRGLRPADHDRQSASSQVGGGTGCSSAVGGGRFAQNRGRTGSWSGEESPILPQKRGIRRPISAQAFTCMLMSSGFELSRASRQNRVRTRFCIPHLRMENRDRPSCRDVGGVRGVVRGRRGPDAAVLPGGELRPRLGESVRRARRRTSGMRWHKWGSSW